MSTWTNAELAQLARAEELRIAGRREDDTLRKPVIIWMVTHDADLYVRSVNGADAAWFRGTQVRGEGHISSGRIDRDVVFTRADDVDDTLDAAYASKYPGWPSAVEHINSAAARATTLRVDPV